MNLTRYSSRNSLKFPLMAKTDGNGANAEPIFFTHNVTPERLSTAGRAHTRGILRDAGGARIQFIAFSRMPDEFPPAPWDIVYSPHINRFNGNEMPQLRIHDVKTASRD